MMIFLTIIHAIVCVFLILVVLLQQGKSADWSGTFGGGSSQASFGQRTGATLLSRATTTAAIIFMVTSLALTIVAARPGSRSVIPADAQAPAPAPAPPTTAPVAEPGAAPAAPAGDQKAAEPTKAPEPAKGQTK